MSHTSILRPSRVLRRLRAGETATCVKINLADPAVVQIAGQVGFDCVWLDLEHVPHSIRDIVNSINAAKAHDCDALVRVSKGSYSDYIRPLEADASGIMVPHVISGKEAANVAMTTRFHPIGLRALDGGNADGAFCAAPLDQYIAHANHERFVIVQIEDPEAIDHLDAIAQTPGIDMLFFGPGDFTHALGVPGAFDDPRVQAARVNVVEAAHRHGKFAGTVTSIRNIEEMKSIGYQFLSCGADVVALLDAFRQTINGFGQNPDRQGETGAYRSK